MVSMCLQRDLGCSFCTTCKYESVFLFLLQVFLVILYRRSMSWNQLESSIQILAAMPRQHVNVDVWIFILVKCDSSPGFIFVQNFVGVTTFACQRCLVQTEHHSYWFGPAFYSLGPVNRSGQQQNNFKSMSCVFVIFKLYLHRNEFLFIDEITYMSRILSSLWTTDILSASHRSMTKTMPSTCPA